MVGTMGLPCRCSADSRGGGGTKSTSGTMGIRETKASRGINGGVTIREPTAVAGVPQGRGQGNLWGDHQGTNGGSWGSPQGGGQGVWGEHGESRTVSMVRGIAWEGM